MGCKHPVFKSRRSLGGVFSLVFFLKKTSHSSPFQEPSTPGFLSPPPGFGLVPCVKGRGWGAGSLFQNAQGSGERGYKNTPFSRLDGWSRRWEIFIFIIFNTRNMSQLSVPKTLHPLSFPFAAGVPCVKRASVKGAFFGNKEERGLGWDAKSLQE